MQLQISLIASAARPLFWEDFYSSLLENKKCTWEVVFVGPNKPLYPLPSNFRYEYATVKPAQCYEIAARLAKGILVGWTADDARYNRSSLNCPNSLDKIWEAYETACVYHNDNKTILAQRTIEDGTDISEKHRFFHGDLNTPLMAPLGFMNREWFMFLGGYDKNFICGQSENDIVMRGLQDGGRVELISESKVFLSHAECHGEYTFRHGYGSDRAYLEKCWCNPHVLNEISPVRLSPFEPFLDDNITTVNQGPAGRWA